MESRVLVSNTGGVRLAERSSGPGPSSSFPMKDQGSLYINMQLPHVRPPSNDTKTRRVTVGEDLRTPVVDAPPSLIGSVFSVMSVPLQTVLCGFFLFCGHLKPW